ncbi:hypothetical protein [Pseudonocardia sp. KRD291]|uniref:hypothetical protein n=1 Tax=Pseudonocardia sp. KRD291 TaxID=2792007 RepID=UPI001C4A42B9|nr:hypothetical protein [Pseudonocardia sp. KRD291]MBW0101197.1 hypothetical protein [Pseudonocardia sp. KRD291]
MTVGRHMAWTADEDPATRQIARVEADPVAAPAPEPAAPHLTLVRGTTVLRVALGVAAVLVIAHFAALAIGHGRPGFEIPQAIRLGGELNIATWFSSALHLVNAGLLALVAANSVRRERVRWIVLALAVLVVSMDEVSANHEQVGYILHTTLGTSGFLTYAWIIPATVLVAVVALWCGPMVLRRPGGRLVALAALIFVGGAVGVEAIEGWWFDETGRADDLVYLVLGGLEEAMEMLGLIVAMAGLLRMAGGSGLRLAGTFTDRS